MGEEGEKREKEGRGVSKGKDGVASFQASLQHLSLAVVLQATDAGVRRPGYCKRQINTGMGRPGMRLGMGGGGDGHTNIMIQQR